LSARRKFLQAYKSVKTKGGIEGRLLGRATERRGVISRGEKPPDGGGALGETSQEKEKGCGDKKRIRKQKGTITVRGCRGGGGGGSAKKAIICPAVRGGTPRRFQAQAGRGMPVWVVRCEKGKVAESLTTRGFNKGGKTCHNISRGGGGVRKSLHGAARS